MHFIDYRCPHMALHQGRVTHDSRQSNISFYSTTMPDESKNVCEESWPGSTNLSNTVATEGFDN